MQVRPSGVTRGVPGYAVRIVSPAAPRTAGTMYDVLIAATRNIGTATGRIPRCAFQLPGHTAERCR